MIQESVFVFDWENVKAEVLEEFNLGNICH